MVRGREKEDFFCVRSLQFLWKENNLLVLISDSTQQTNKQTANSRDHDWQQKIAILLGPRKSFVFMQL